VASGVGGVTTLIEHEKNGLLVPPGDPDALSESLERLIRDPQLRRDLGAAARRTIEDGFDWRRIHEKYEELFRAVLSRYPGVDLGLGSERASER
jgi:glycosyltransferase involved in cell wall biosynthesis